MKRFTELYEELDKTTRTSVKVEAMATYFRDVPAEDAAWAVFFLTGQRFKRLISGRTLRHFAERRSGLPSWLVEDAHAAVGDSAETASLLIDTPEPGAAPGHALHVWVEERILTLRGLDLETQYERITAAWADLPRPQAFVFNKLLTGAFRVGVSTLLVVRALEVVSGLPRAMLSHRLMGRFEPSAAAYRNLLGPETEAGDRSRPYPFYLASPLEQDPETLGSPDAWLIEWKWDGIRAQLIRRGGEIFIWSRGEELITDRFPEVVEASAQLPDGLVLDGELLAWDETLGVLPFSALQTRIGRERIGPKVLASAPVRFLAYDLLERAGADLRPRPLAERRQALATLLEAHPTPIGLSATIQAPTWAELAAYRETSRERGVEGLMLKRLTSAYGFGRQRGAWWKWKVEPLTIDAVLIYAQAGSGRRSNLFTDYTFAVWRGDDLVPVAKAYSGLDDKEILALDRWIRRNTRERFGPVRSVDAVQVFELAFEGLSRSKRHKAGVALRFPRIKRWRSDLTPKDADRLEMLEVLLPADR